MNNEISIPITDVYFEPAVIRFGNADEILKSAEKLNAQLSTVVVTEDTLAISKKLVATVRKRANELDQTRKDLKKELLIPYLDFEKKVKEILSTVEEGENIIRLQVRAMEDEERADKKKQLLNCLNRRVKHYPEILSLGVDIERLIEPRMLNKTVNVEKSEAELAQGLEEINRALQTIKTLPHSPEITVEYVATLDLINSISTVNERMSKIEKVNQEIKPVKNQTHTIEIYSDSDYIKVINFLNTNNIKYKGDK